ncbi:hydrogenase nickel incorporation protein HypB [Hydrogenispora ethanolica]|jgi:hydrogenase nickel incorporation protein HypB|uniref:Hydrogenase nickel incorporation protein HypB n=1 Tax=Hydrogenispora ethanolica TaxID=1082276 RepID=A0A4R1RMF2_HYDET|nr:hydrogenase nickel incorporation protein HypB [Hydrogenispora ethanolica]TCL67356.1 hydrogenase nickel incorporation protein HypB [Hydrogenispora ethanolica]
MEIDIEQDLFENEAKLAELNRSWFAAHRVAAVNLLAAPGAGKTSLIRRTAALCPLPLAVIEGDPASRIDTDLLNGLGIPAHQINTEGGCHLEAQMIGQALQEFQPAAGTVLFIENVGNLICTASFPLGEALRVVMLGVSEGDDKPFKYPLIFEEADAVILNKIDLGPFVDFDRERFYRGIRTIDPEVPVFEVSCRTGAGLAEWSRWLERKAGEYLDAATV